jgi:hypothetical protein
LSDSRYWSSITHAINPDWAWAVVFERGGVSLDDKLGAQPVRAVRGGQPDVSDPFVNNGDGTITDTNTGLVWQQATGGSMNWEAALIYCENLFLAGHNNWRLPNRNELQSIMNYGKINPAIDTDYFPDLGGHYEWSSTTEAGNTSRAWLVNFYSAGIILYDKSNQYHVRAVRGSVPMVAAGAVHTLGLKSDGTVVAVGANVGGAGTGQCDVSSWTDIVQVAGGIGHTVGLKSDSTVVAVGDNKWGQLNVSSWTDIVQVAANHRHTVGRAGSRQSSSYCGC